MFKLERFPEARPRFTDQLSFVAEPGTRVALQRAADAEGRTVPDLLREATGAVLARVAPARPSLPAAIGEEDFGAALPEVMPLWDAHWGADAPTDLAPDWPRFAALAAGGLLVLTAARLDGALVGALASLVDGHLHYRSTLVAQMVLNLLHPDCRGSDLGVRLLASHQAALKARGVVKAAILASPAEAATLGLLDAGWREQERTFLKEVI